MTLGGSDMKKRKILSLFLITSILIGLWQTVNAALPSNYDYTGALDKTALFDYIDRKLIEVSDTVFCIGQDKIEYYMTFEDEDRDYPITGSYTYEGKATKTNEKGKTNSLSELVKQVKAGTLKVKYEHDPSIYDNPVPKSSKSDGKWHSVKTSFDTDKSKWRVINLVEEDYLFFEPTDATRGSWKIYIQGSDDTGKPAFDKISEHYATFRVHKAPVPKFNFTESGSTATLSDAGSYDIDYEIRKNSRKNKPNDREYKGIKEFYWSAKIGDEWVDIGTGPSVTFNKNGKIVSDYRLTVEDYDGAFASISKNALIIDKPIVNFNYTIGGTYTSYAYQGNVNHETTSVKSEITWNDEAYMNWLYNTSGERYAKYTAIKTGEYKENKNLTNWNTLDNAFSNDILQPKFLTIANNNKISVNLTARNKYDASDSVQKDLQIKHIDVVPKNGSSTKDVVFEDITPDYADFTYTSTTQLTPAYASYVGKKAFTVGMDIPFRINEKKGATEDLKVTVKSNGAEKEVKSYGGPLQGTIPKEELPWNNSNTWDKLSYSVQVYSKRDNNKLLHKYTSELLIRTPVPVEGSISGDEIMTDEAFTLTAISTKYAKSVEVSFPVPVTTNGTKYPANTKIALTRVNEEKWNKNFILSSDDVDEEQEITINLYSTAYNNRDAGYNTVSAKVNTIQLYDLMIIFNQDVNWKNYYFDSHNNFKSNTEIKTMKMPANKGFSVSNAPEGIKSGYNVHFFVTSKGLLGSNDYVVLDKAIFKKNNATIGTQEVSKKWTRITDSNKNSFGFSPYILQMINNIKSNEQLWYIKYTIPLNLEKQTEIIFDIDAYKNGVNKYNYNTKTPDTYRSGIEKGDVIYIIGNLNEDNRAKTSH